MKVTVDATPAAQELLTKTSDAPRPGFKTTEFWISLGMFLAGCFLLGKDQFELGSGLIAASGMGYQANRAYVKGKRSNEVK